MSKEGGEHGSEMTPGKLLGFGLAGTVVLIGLAVGLNHFGDAVNLHTRAIFIVILAVSIVTLVMNSKKKDGE